MATSHDPDQDTLSELHRLRAAIETWDIAVYEHDHLTGVIYGSPRHREMYGFGPDEVLTVEMVANAVHPDDSAMVYNAIKSSHEPSGDGIFNVVHRIFRADGSLRWLHTRARSIFGDVDGERVCLLTTGSVVDITDRQNALIEKRRRTEILDATPDFVAMADLDRRMLYLNRAGREFLGLGLDDDLDGRHISSNHTEEAFTTISEVGIPAAIRDGVWTAETDFLRHDGAIVPMSQVLLSHRDDAGEITHLSTIARDLTREKNLEEQFRQAQKLEAIGRLAGGVAHDFNNLLSAIMGFTDLALAKLGPGHPVRDDLAQVQRAADRSASLTGQLLAFSRKQILKPRVIDLNEVVNDLGSMIRRLMDENVRITLDTAPEAIRVKADPVQIEQILLNLVVNARDAMPDGGVLSLEVERVVLDDRAVGNHLDLGPGCYAVIVVSDTGSGMDAETRENIFEPFFTTKGLGEGTGLGLSTVFGIVKQSGGSVSVDSELGRGTTFKLYFPCTDESPAAPDRAPPARRGSRGGVVLVAEDDETLREMISGSLREAGFEVLGGASGVEALETARAYSGKIDLLLTDVLMPGMSGKQLAERLVTDRPSTAVLFMSGYAENIIAHHGVLEEGVDFLAKPFGPRRLVAAVDGVLSRHALGGSAVDGGHG